MQREAKIQLKRGEKLSLPQEVVNQIGEMITNGHLSPGDRLLSERQLAEIFKVSRTAVREGLAKLGSMGILEIRPGEGAYVREFSLDFLVEPLSAGLLTALLGEGEAIKQLLEVREILESKIVVLATERATNQDISLLKLHASRVMGNIDEGSDASKTDTDFHISLAAATHNKILYNIMLMLSRLMKETYGPARVKMLRGSNAKIYGEHHFRICEAIENRRRKEAQQIMLEHLQLARKDALKA